MRRGSSIMGTPVLIGCATVLVCVVAVLLAYNANQGLPFAPSYDLTVEMPTASNLVVGNEVRVGGTRVGQVRSIEAKQHKDGEVTALIGLKIDKQQEDLPVDSTFLVRQQTALGLKYVQITRGFSARKFPNGATVSIKNATPEPVEIDEIFNTFDERTRRASQDNLREFGNALAGRGRSLNDAVPALSSVFKNLEPVMENLASGRTDLGRFVRALGGFTGQIAPVAEQQADLFVNLNRTFAALASVAVPYIQESISNAPPLLETGIRTLPYQQKFLADTERLMAALRPGVSALTKASPDLAQAVVQGTQTFRRSPPFNRQLEQTFGVLQQFNQDPRVPRGFEDLAETMTQLAPTVAYVTPAQTVCNYITLFMRNASSTFSDVDGTGSWARILPLAMPSGPNAEVGPSEAPANGGGSVDQNGIGLNYLHVNPYPNTASPGQTFECEAGNEPYAPQKVVVGNPPGNQGTNTDGQTTKGSSK